MANSVSSAAQGLAAGVRAHQQDRAQDLAEAQAEFEAGPEGHPEQGYKGKQLALQTAEAQAKAQAEIDRNRIADQWVKIGQQQVDQQKLANPTIAKQQDLEYNRALFNAQSFGGYDDENEVSAVHPTLTPGQATAIAMVSQNVRRQKESEYGFAQNAAATLNRRDALKKSLTDLGVKPGDEPPKAGWFTSDAGKAKNQQIAQALSEWKDIAPKASKIESDKRLSGLINYEPSSDAYQPAMPAPPWQQQFSRGSATPQSPPSAATGSSRAGAGGLSTNPAPAQNQMVMPTMRVPAQAATQVGTARQQYDPWVYQRVRELVGAGAGAVSVPDAKKQALLEYQSAAADGNLP